MGVALIVLGIIVGIAALVGVVATVIALIDGYEIVPVIVAAFVSIALAVGCVVLVRQGSWMYGEQRCDSIADTNHALDVQHIRITYWDFGCYVDTGDAVIPWERYRAVVDG